MDQRDTIYGVKLDDDITPIDVRNAIIQCYYEADLQVLQKLFQQSDFESVQDEKDTKYKHVQLFIKKIFDEVQADFNNPSKESLMQGFKCPVSKLSPKIVIGSLATLFGCSDSSVGAGLPSKPGEETLLSLSEESLCFSYA